MSVNGAGGYVTRGRAGELETLIAAVEARLHERIDALEAELEAARRFPLEVARANVQATLSTLERHGGLHRRPPQAGGDG